MYVKLLTIECKPKLPAWHTLTKVSQTLNLREQYCQGENLGYTYTLIHTPCSITQNREDRNFEINSDAYNLRI